MSEFKDHYKKLEELGWTYSQDFPVPDGADLNNTLPAPSFPITS